MKFRIVDLAKDYPFQPITDFAKARNYFVENLPDGEYVLFTSDHEDLPKSLLDHIASLKPEFPYYNIRLICLMNGKRIPGQDNRYVANLVSNRMRFVRPIHEIPTPVGQGGVIEIPMIHNATSVSRYDNINVPRWYYTRAYGLLQAIFQFRDTIRDYNRRYNEARESFLASREPVISDD